MSLPCTTLWASHSVATKEEEVCIAAMSGATEPTESTPLVGTTAATSSSTRNGSDLESRNNTLLLARLALYLERLFPKSYGAHADLQQSWAYFEHFVLPRRIQNADGSYSKAKPGHPDSTLYPPWTTPLVQLKDFGTGIAVYFETLLLLTGICLVAGLLYLPTILYYASDDYTETHSVFGWSLKGSLMCPAPIWVPCSHCVLEDFADNPGRISNFTEDGLLFVLKNTCSPLHWSQGLNHLVVMVFVAGSLFGLGFYQSKLELQYDELVLTASDYSIQVDNPAPDVHDPEVYREFFEQFGEVEYITVARNNTDLLNALARRRALLQKAAFRTQGGDGQFTQEIPDSLAESMPKLYKKLVKVDAKCRELVKVPPAVSAVFVTFQKEAAQRLALKTLQVGKFNILNNNIGALAPEFRFQEKLVLDVFEAPEPSAIRWQDLDESHVAKVFQRIVTVLLTIVVTAAGFLLVESAFRTDVDLAATEIALLNIVMPILLKFINGLESHQSESTFQASLYWKIAVFRWINTGVVTILIKPNSATLADTKDGLIMAVHAVLKAEIIIAPIMHMLNLPGQLKRLILAPGALNQSAMNSYFRGGKQFLGEKYTNATKTIFLVFFYSAIFPAGFFFGAVALLLTYVVDKFLLLRSWAPMPALGDDVARLGRKVFFPLTAVVLALMSEFFYSAYPFDDLCDTDRVVEEGSRFLGVHTIVPSIGGDKVDVSVDLGDTLYRFCDQDFLERFNTLLNFFFAEKDDWMKGDQQGISWVFGLFAVGTTAVMVLLNLQSDLETVKTETLGGYVRNLPIKLISSLSSAVSSDYIGT